MDATTEMILSHYISYLIKKQADINEIKKGIKSLEHIKLYETKTRKELEKLEGLSKEYKLYDSNYDSFMMYMGRLSLGVEKVDNLNLDDSEKSKLINNFININNRFEELEQCNIMKDVYVWQYLD